MDGDFFAFQINTGEYDLFDLMAHVTEENLHAPVDSGPPVGREAL